MSGKGDLGANGAATAQAPRPWWESRLLLLAVVLIAAVPLLYPEVPPLVDLLGHMGRYRVQLDSGSSAWLKDYYGFHWAAIGNLGVDLLVMPLGRLLGLEPAVKLIVIAIPPLTVAGFLWVAREVHGRIPPTAFFALPFALGHPFLFGFVNYALSIALAFLAFGLWLELARRGKLKLRAILFVPISFVIFITHAYGWGTLGLLAFSAEAVRQHDKGMSWWKAGLRAAMHAAVMAGPVLMMLAWRSTVQQGGTADWFNWTAKLNWMMTALRDRWKWFDIAGVGVAVFVLAIAIVNRRLTYSRNLAFSALVLLAGFLIVPRILFASAYADMRLAPYMIATALLAIRFKAETVMPTARVLAVLGVGFYLARIAATTASLGIAANDQQAKLEALEHVTRGAAVVGLFGLDCDRPWALPRNAHLPAIAIVRRHAFSNDQWAIEGSNLLSVRYRRAGRYMSDPSELVREARCANREHWDINRALATIPRDAFDYVWLIDVPPYDPRLVEGMRPIWRGSGSLLYAVEKPGEHSQP